MFLLRLRKAVLPTGCLASIGLFSYQSASAQSAQEPTDRSWTVAAWVLGAYQLSGGRLATAPSNIVQLPLANSVADLESSPLVGAGLDLDFPERRVGLRLAFEATIGAEARSQIGVCEVVQGAICEPEIVSASVRGITAQLRAYRGNPDWPVEPILGGGVGLKLYSFGLPDCTARAIGPPRAVCGLNSDFFRGNSRHVVFRVLVGARTTRGRMASELTLGGGIGKYGGGTQRVNGNWHTDLRIALSASIRVL